MQPAAGAFKHAAGRGLEAKHVMRISRKVKVATMKGDVFGTVGLRLKPSVGFDERLPVVLELGNWFALFSLMSIITKK